MRRRDAEKKKAGRKAARPKARKSVAAVSTGSPEQLDRLKRERDEAMERQAATSEVLKLISRSTFDLQAVFDTLVTSAARLCRADKANITLHRDDRIEYVAAVGFSPEHLQYMQSLGLKVHRGSISGRCVLEGKTVHVPDVLADPEFALHEAQKRGSFRTALGVPLLRDGTAIGTIFLSRATVDPFNKKQIELVTTFAAQAVIAIENARLLSELRESLQQQTATADVLKVISRSTFDLQTVLNTLVESAARLCEAESAHIFRRTDSMYELAACHGYPREYKERMGHYRLAPGRESLVGRIALEGRMVHIPDAIADPEYNQPRAQQLGRWRTMIGVPLIREDNPIGALTLTRSRVQPFTDKQIELLTSFAAQAVIAIENVRLFDELSESLEQQTATSEVLKVISSSPGELKPVFQAMLEKAVQVCGAKFGILFLTEGDGFRTTAMHDVPRAFAEKRERGAFVCPPAESPLGRAKRTRQVAHVADITAEQGYAQSEPLRDLAELGGARTTVCVPMLNHDELVGAITIYHKEVRPFTDKQIEVLTNFAAQAVIAIENARLLSELRESLAQQTATSEVLNVIASSTGELACVFSALLANATRLCEASYGALWLREDDAFRTAALHGDLPQSYLEQWRSGTLFRPRPDVPMARVAATGEAVQVADLRETQAYRDGDRLAVTGVEDGGIGTIAAVPMFRDKELIGVIAIYRREVRPFSDKQVEIVTNFAAQAVIAVENARLLNELRETLERQTATSEVLKVISSSPGELEPVFNTMLANATRICEATSGNLFLREGTVFRSVAAHSQHAESWRRNPVIDLRDNPGIPLDRIAATKQVAHIPDLKVDQSYIQKNGRIVTLVEVGGARTHVSVPMIKEGELVGAIAMYRQEVRPFTDKQIELVQNFAAQAVIAIENARLLNELRQRTDDLTKSLEQQTATADVLSVMSRSKFDLMPILQSVVNTAARLCRADQAVIFRLEDGLYRFAAGYSLVPEYLEIERANPIAPGPGTAVGQAAMTRAVVRIEDAMSEAGYEMKDQAAIAHLHSIIGVPLLRDGEPIGVVALARCRIEPFSDREIELVTTFADQAVIAIENVRLFDEVQARTEDLQESLQQQTATADVLKVISSSPGSLEPVFKAMLENAVRICHAQFGVMHRFVGDAFEAVAMLNIPPALEEFLRRRGLAKAIPGADMDILYKSKDVVHTLDMLTSPSPAPPAKLAGARTQLAVPMLKDAELVGAIVIYRQEVLPFANKQIELVQNFAAQAVIAIENARLLAELRESLQQQTATADVLKVISRSTFNLQTVLNTLVESAARLCEADSATIHRPQGAAYPYVASFGLSREYDEYMRGRPIIPGRGTVLGRAVTEGRPVQLQDVTADPEYTMTEGQRLGGFRTVLGVPLMREGTPIGVIMLTRNTVRPFTDKQIELATTFADQAAIAIENVRLFESVEARTRELAKSLEELRTAQDRLVQTEKLASLGQLTAGIAHEIKNPLNFVNNFSAISVELIDELRQALAEANLDAKLRAQISEIADMLQGNLDKVVQHGKRADSIVKNMLLHSRQGSQEHRPVDINALVEESLNLAYHGARAEKQGFNITLERSFDPTAGEVDVFPQEITRVLLNLISNGFYAATKRKEHTNNDAYDPTLAAATRNLGDDVEIRIRDNGTGIPPEVRDKLFNPFFTTKPVGEGTGLGLSISHDIIVKQHGGSIEVATQPGEFTEFRIVLPRTGASLATSGARA